MISNHDELPPRSNTRRILPPSAVHSRYSTILTPSGNSRHTSSTFKITQFSGALSPFNRPLSYYTA